MFEFGVNVFLSRSAAERKLLHVLVHLDAGERGVRAGRQNSFGFLGLLGGLGFTEVGEASVELRRLVVAHRLKRGVVQTERL